MSQVSPEHATHILTNQTNHYYTKNNTNYLSFKIPETLEIAKELSLASPKDIEFHKFLEEPKGCRWGALLYKINPDKTCALVSMNVDSSG